MPLLVNILSTAILQMTDSSRGDFVGYPIVLLPDGSINKPATNDLVATNWARAAKAYFLTISVPVILPPVHTVAEAAFKAAMAPLLAAPPPVATKALDAGFKAYAAVLAASSTSPGVTAPPIPPLDPLITAALLPTSLLGTADPGPPARAIAATIDGQWVRTGTVTPPTGTPIPWS